MWVDGMRSRATRGVLASALTVATVSGGCLSTEFMSPERAVVERAAIHHDLRHDTGTLYAIASKRAKLVRPDLSDRSVVCAISNIEIQFVSEARATYTVAYACGIAPWQLGHAPPVATPAVSLDVWKLQDGTWQINGFL
jgi:hypothetical protein